MGAFPIGLMRFTQRPAEFIRAEEWNAHDLAEPACRLTLREPLISQDRVDKQVPGSTASKQRRAQAALAGHPELFHDADAAGVLDHRMGLDADYIVGLEHVIEQCPAGLGNQAAPP